MKTTADTATFVQHLTGCQSRLYAYVVTLLGGARDAGDVLQETNAVLWNKHSEYDASRPFLPWAYRFAFLQVQAHRKRLTRDRLLFDDELLASIASEYVRQDAGAEQQLAALEGCLQQLPARQRTLIEQRYSGGITVSSLADQANSDANAISAMLYRIRHALAECIRRKLVAGETT
jgi:RNA polymerase sigma-70 factor (ECF subfamily)